MRYWITREGLDYLRSAHLQGTEEEKVLSSLLASGNGMSVRDIAGMLGWGRSNPEELREVCLWIDDILGTFRNNDLVTTSRARGVTLGYEASIPQTSIDYQSAIPGLRGDFEVSTTQVGLSKLGTEQYRPSEEFYLGKN